MHPESAVLRILVLDEQEVVRRGVRHELERDPQITVIALAASVAEAVSRGLALRPDVAVVGMELPDGTGADACARLRAGVPGLRCLALSRCDDRATVTAAVRAGMSGYLLKHESGPAIVSAVRTIAAGGSAFSRELTATAPAGADPLQRLTDRERAVLRLIGEGLTNRQIGGRLGLAEKTVKNYISHLMPKLGLERRTQAAVLATQLRDHLVDRDDAAGHRLRTGPRRRLP